MNDKTNESEEIGFRDGQNGDDANPSESKPWTEQPAPMPNADKNDENKTDIGFHDDGETVPVSAPTPLNESSSGNTANQAESNVTENDDNTNNAYSNNTNNLYSLEENSTEDNFADDNPADDTVEDNTATEPNGDLEGNDLEAESGNEADDQKETANSISADLIRGHINTIILRTLYERDKYGYEIMNEIEEKSHGQYSLKQPTLYSALKRLETQGYIKAYWKKEDISGGGRRKYFKLTETGKEVTEKNQAEWEYSRTVIDNLISDRSFDFSQPAPSPLDLKILKQSTTRTPLLKEEPDENQTENLVEPKPASAQPVQNNEAQGEATTQTFINQATATTEQPATEQTVSQPVSQQPTQEQPVPEQTVPLGFAEPLTAEQLQAQQQAAHQALLEQQAAQQAAQQELLNQQAAQQAAQQEQLNQQAAQLAEQQAKLEQAQQAALLAKIEKQAKEDAEAEQRKRVHENYLKLINTPTKAQNPAEEDTVKVAENIPAESLLYANKPVTERDYRNLINKIYTKAIRNTGTPKAVVPVVQEETATPAYYPQEPRDGDIMAKANSDGLKVNSSEVSAPARTASKSTFHKGWALLKSSLIISVLLILEFVIATVLREELGVSIVYPIVILAIAVVQFGVFATLHLSGYGKNTRKTTSHSYLTVSIVVTILTMLIICVLAILFEIDFSAINQIVAKIILPCAVAMNIPIFALSYFYFTR